MIDFHTHVIPDIDDGSRSVCESIQMLRMSADMGVDTIVATPHFYAGQKSISEFISRRKHAFDSLMEACAAEAEAEVPDIVLGAEVEFFPGMSGEADISLLCIADTRYMLLEMPFEPWSRRTMNEVRALLSVYGINPIIAHIERYFSIQGNDTINGLLDMEVPVQINGSYLINTQSRRKALKLFKENCAHLLGSDCHNMTSRKPNLDKACEIIKRKLGNEKLNQIEALGRSILQAGN